MSAARIEVTATELVVHTPYSESLVESLKQLPRWARRWDPDAKVWRLDPGQLYTVTQLMLRYAPSVEVLGGPDGDDVTVYRDGRRETQARLF